jgi:hypothetical protein
VDARGKAENGLEGRHGSAPPVETKGELVQIGLEVIVTDAVVGAPGSQVLRLPKTRWMCGRSLAAHSGVPWVRGLCR